MPFRAQAVNVRSGSSSSTGCWRCGREFNQRLQQILDTQTDPLGRQGVRSRGQARRPDRCESTSACSSIPSASSWRTGPVRPFCPGPRPWDTAASGRPDGRGARRRLASYRQPLGHGRRYGGGAFRYSDLRRSIGAASPPCVRVLDLTAKNVASNRVRRRDYCGPRAFQPAKSWSVGMTCERLLRGFEDCSVPAGSCQRFPVSLAVPQFCLLCRRQTRATSSHHETSILGSCSIDRLNSPSRSRMLRRKRPRGGTRRRRCSGGSARPLGVDPRNRHGPRRT